MENSVVKSVEQQENIPLIATVIIYILGLCTMLPWNFFITANSFWQYKLRNTTLQENWNSPDVPLTSLQVSFTPTLVILSNMTCFLFGFLTSGLTRRIQERDRIIGSLVISLLSMGLVTVLSIVDTDGWQEVFFALSLSMVVLMNIGIAVLQASLYGMIGFFPPKCVTMLVSGQSLAGVVSSLSEIISLAIGKEDPIVSGVIYFCLADGFIVLTIYSYIKMIRLDFYKCRTKQREKEEKRNTSLDEYFTVLKKIFWMGVSFGFVLLVTLSMYPSVQVYITSSHSPSTWADIYFQPTITFLLFNVADMIGRESSGYIRWPSHKGYLFHVTSACRVFFIPFILLCNGQNKTFPTLFNRDVYYILINLLFGLSNGYFSSLAMIYYPRLVEKHEIELAGTLMASLMGAGMVMGSCLSPAFVTIWGPNN